MLVLLAYSPEKTTAQTIPENPNIIVVLTDDQPESTLRYMPELQKRMGAYGTKFSNYIFTDPVCCPSRATMLTGDYVHSHQVLTNAAPAGAWQKFSGQGLQNDTVATRLDEAGYQTAYYGKYMNGYDGKSVPPGYDNWGAYVHEKNAPDGLAGDKEYGVRRDLSRFPLKRKTFDVTTRDVTLRWLDYMDRDGMDERPFFLTVSFYGPHSWGYFEDRHKDMYRDMKAPRMPAYNEVDYSDKPNHRPRLTQAQKDWTDVFYRRQVLSLQGIDYTLMRIIQKLRVKGELDNTYIVYATDNGVHHGENRLQRGKGMPYEPDINVPMYVRGPGVSEGKVSQKLVGNHDLAPTFANLGGASTEGMDGRSFAPLLSDPQAPWRTAILSEFYSAASGGALQWRAVRTEDESYIEWAGNYQGRELYDLNTDPHQLNNSLYNPTPEAEARASELSSRLDALKDCSGEECRIAEN